MEMNRDSICILANWRKKQHKKQICLKTAYDNPLFTDKEASLFFGRWNKLNGIHPLVVDNNILPLGLKIQFFSMAQK